ncbi:MAG: GntR family transcriptional regulator [Terrimesophilobacter sp.]
MHASEMAYRALRDEIVDWELRPGTVLAEVEQSVRLGISRTPLRAALVRLTADGLVAPQVGRGLVVTDVSPQNIRELFEVRRALEEQAVRLAAERGDVAVFEVLERELLAVSDLLEGDDPGRRAYYDLVRRFDDAVDHAVANPYLVTALRGLRTHLVRIRRHAKDDPGRLRGAAAEHLMIVQAIIDRDAELAAHATHVHLHRALQNALAGTADRTSGRSGRGPDPATP